MTEGGCTVYTDRKLIIVEKGEATWGGGDKRVKNVGQKSYSSIRGNWV